jgi:hypothetical protein
MLRRHLIWQDAFRAQRDHKENLAPKGCLNRQISIQWSFAKVLLIAGRLAAGFAVLRSAPELDPIRLNRIKL